jgi:hypothetical protein
VRPEVLGKLKIIHSPHRISNPRPSCLQHSSLITALHVQIIAYDWTHNVRQMEGTPFLMTSVPFSMSAFQLPKLIIFPLCCLSRDMESNNQQRRALDHAQMNGIISFVYFCGFCNSRNKDVLRWNTVTQHFVSEIVFNRISGSPIQNVTAPPSSFPSCCKPFSYWSIVARHWTAVVGSTMDTTAAR